MRTLAKLIAAPATLNGHVQIELADGQWKGETGWVLASTFGPERPL